MLEYKLNDECNWLLYTLRICTVYACIHVYSIFCIYNRLDLYLAVIVDVTKKCVITRGESLCSYGSTMLE